MSAVFDFPVGISFPDLRSDIGEMSIEFAKLSVFVVDEDAIVVDDRDNLREKEICKSRLKLRQATSGLWTWLLKTWSCPSHSL